jgi:peptidoglycan hydrolase CwlO-like protein
VTTKEDIASVAGQLAALTKTVEQMAAQLGTLRKDAASQQERSDTQEDRINIAARELAEVSERLQAAANALRQSLDR